MNKNVIKVCGRRVGWLLCLWCVVGYAGMVDPYHLENPAQRRAFEDLTVTLRCLVCQNQSVADSQTPMAHDLRLYIAKRLRAGDDEASIHRSLLQRYGDAISFKPPMRRHTAFLWGLPWLLLVVVLLLALKPRNQSGGGR